MHVIFDQTFPTSLLHTGQPIVKVGACYRWPSDCLSSAIPLNVIDRIMGTCSIEAGAFYSCHLLVTLPLLFPLPSPHSHSLGIARMSVCFMQAERIDYILPDLLTSHLVLLE